MAKFENLRAAWSAVRMAFVLLLLGVSSACSADNRGVFHTAKGDFAFNLEIADTEAAREVVHDAMLHLLERIGQFRGDAPFWGWLRQIVVNQALMRMRHNRGIAFEGLPDDDHWPASAEAPCETADTQHLQRALQRLPALTRSVLWLYHVEEYTHVEIAALTGKSVSFSKSQVARGGSRLRALLESTLDHPQEAAPCLTATAH